MAKLHQIAFEIGGKIASSFKSSIQGATTGLETLGKRVKTLEQGTKQIDRFKSLRSSIQKTEQKLKDAQTKTAELGRQLSQTAKPTKALQQAFQQAQNRSAKLKTTLTDQKISLQRLKNEMSAAGVATSNLTGEQKRLTSALERTKSAQARLETVMAKKAANQKRRESLRGQGIDALAGGFALKSVFAPAIGFEQGMARVKALSGATGVDFDALTRKARELGQHTSFSAREASEGMSYLAMAGFETDQIIDAMPGVLNMAKASMTDLGTTADISSDILSAFGLEASEMNRVADVLTRTFTTSNTSLQMLGDTMRYVAPVSAKAGISLEKTAAMAGLLADVGIKGASAGVAMRSMILRLSSPPKMAAKALDDLKIKTKDAAGNLRPIGDLLQEISTKILDKGSGDRLGILSKIFGKEASAAMAELVGKAEKTQKAANVVHDTFAGSFLGDAMGIKKGDVDKSSIAAYFKTIEETSAGASARIAKIQGDTTAGAFTALKSSLEGLSITFSNLFLPALKGIAHGLKWIANVTTGLVQDWPILTTIIGGAVGGMLALKVAAIGFGYAATFVRGSWLNLIGIPGQIGEKWQAFKDSAFLARMKKVGSALKNAGTKAWEYGKVVGEHIGKGFSKAGDAIKRAGSSVLDFGKRVGTSIGKGFTAAGKAIQSAATSLWSFATNAAKTAWSALVSLATGLKKATIGMLGMAKSAAIAAAGGLKSLALSVIGFAKTAIPAAIAGLKSLAIAAWSNPIILIGAAIAGTAILIYKFWEPISDFFSDMWSGIKDAFSAAFDWISSFSLFDSGVALLESLADGIWSVVSAPARAVMSAFDWIADLLPFSDAKKGPLKRLTKSGSAIVTTMGQGVQKAGPQAIQAPLTKAFDALNAKPNYLAPAVQRAGNAPQRAPATNITVTISPTIHLAPGMDKNATKAVLDESMADTERRFREWLENYHMQQKRTGFGTT